MRYMTKEWYETMQKTDLHLPLSVSKQAEVFSEDYFRQLYKREETKWVKLQKEVSEVRFEDVFPEAFYAEYADDSPLKGSDLDAAEKTYYEQREQARASFNPTPLFDPEQARKIFKQFFRRNIGVLKAKLPEEILQMVADIRVLALNVASREVKQAITKFCRQNEKSVYKAMDDYQKQFRKQFRSNIPAFVPELSLHDCEVLSCRRKGRDILLTVDNSGGSTNIREIRMKNCTVMKQDAPLHGACCLYEEIYKTGEQYEIHFLLNKNRLIDYIVVADDLEYRYTLAKS